MQRHHAARACCLDGHTWTPEIVEPAESVGEKRASYTSCSILRLNLVVMVKQLRVFDPEGSHIDRSLRPGNLLNRDARLSRCSVSKSVAINRGFVKKGSMNIPFSSAWYDVSRSPLCAGSMLSASEGFTEKKGASNAAISSLRK